MGDAVSYTLTGTALLETGCQLGSGHITPAGLLARSTDKQWLVQVSDASGLVDLILLQTVIDGGDLSGYTAEQQAAGTAAEQMLCETCADANSQVDSYLVSAGEDVPLPEGISSRMLSQAAFAIARWLFMDSGDMPETHVIQRQYRAALKTLTQIRDGLLETSTDSEDLAQFTSSARVFTRDETGGF
jgi:phage gp36-like protein